jgi:hypothetical protein
MKALKNGPANMSPAPDAPNERFPTTAPAPVPDEAPLELCANGGKRAPVRHRLNTDRVRRTGSEGNLHAELAKAMTGRRVDMIDERRARASAQREERRAKRRAS